MAEHKLIGFILAAGLCLVAGLFWLIDDSSTPDGTQGEAVTVAPPEAGDGSSAEKQVEPEIAGEPLDETLAGKVLVAKRPVQVLAAPSASASAMYGFPAGRPFRAISQHDGFIRIQDVKSGASGWIEEAALAPAPTMPVAVPDSSSSGSATAGRSGGTSGAGRAPDTAAVEPEPQPQKRRGGGLFGGGGILGGLFGGR